MTPIFPDPSGFDRHGLVAAGGDLSPSSLVAAYEAGVFPWYEEPPILWWSPDPRGILEPASLHVSRSLRRHLRSLAQDAEVTVVATHSIREVMETSGALRERSWITPEMLRAYERLGAQERALAYEVRRKGRLVGGLYGVMVGRLFAAESMFHLETDASKVALTAAVVHQFACGAELFDVQFQTPHLKTMGVYEISRATYLARLRRACAPGRPSGPAGEHPPDGQQPVGGEQAVDWARRLAPLPAPGEPLLAWVVARLNLL